MTEDYMWLVFGLFKGTFLENVANKAISIAKEIPSSFSAQFKNIPELLLYFFYTYVK